MREQVGAARRYVEIELNAIDDNPLVSIASGRMISNGNFHPIVMALAFDALRVGLAHVAMLSERRMNKTSDLKFGNPESFLDGAETASRYGVSGLLAYAAAALVADQTGSARHTALSVIGL